MSSDWAIRAKGISKVFPHKTSAGRVFSNALFGQKAAQKKGKIALAPMDIEVLKGQSIGLVGPNGAGKSTLLSLLANTIPVTSGTIERDGKIAPLLQLSAWFDPMLTGLENMENFFSVFGLSGKELKRAVEKAIDFADIGKFIDAPIYAYSSGMIARVAFSAAISVPAQIMIIDEVLAVGDMAFREKSTKALKRFRENGRTFIIVSQNPYALVPLCTRGLVLHRGRVEYDGDMQGAANAYNDLRSALEKKKKSALLTTDVKAVDDTIVSLLDIKRETHIDAAEPKREIMTLNASFKGVPPKSKVNVELDILHGRGSFVARVEAVGEADETGRLSVSHAFFNRLLSGVYILGYRFLDADTGALRFALDNAYRLHINSQSGAIGQIDLGLKFTATDKHV